MGDSQLKLERVVFERLVLGEDAAALQRQLAARMSEDDARRIVAEALEDLERRRGTDGFAKAEREIRKRRIVGTRYTIWKIIGWTVVVLSILFSGLSFILGSPSFPTGLLAGGIILGLVEWRTATRLLSFKPDTSPEFG